MEASIDLLFRSLKIGHLWGVDLFLHWSMWFFAVFVLVRGWVLYSTDEIILQIALVFTVYVCLAFHELGHLVVARWVGLRLREITLYPLGGSTRLAMMSERPWQEIWVAVAGPLVHLLLAGAIAAGLLANDRDLSPRLDSPEPFLETFFNRLFWLNVVLAGLHTFPVLPFDGGRIFRGALALSAKRLRATEVAALLSSFVSLLFLIAGMIWISTVWWLIPVGIIIHVGGQQELIVVRFYAALQDPDKNDGFRAPTLAPMDKVLDDGMIPPEPDFNGLLWNSKNRLWVVYRNGQPISANALVGE